jgi:putative MATE family efflux protein
VLSASPPAATAPPSARFVQGSTLRHVVVMASTGAIGLIAVFSVDLLNLFYISLLGQQPIAASVGFAGAVGYFQASLGIGLTIGVGAVVSRAIGAGAMDDARRIAGASLLAIFVVTAVLGVLVALFAESLLTLLGAAGQTRTLAATFLVIASPSLPLLAVGMSLSALLRSVGDARRALNVTLYAAFAAAALDPLFIFGLHLGLQGAAISTVLSRLMLVGIGWQGAARVHNLVGRPEPRRMLADLRRVFAIAGPAILTNLATPVGGAYVTRSMATFGTAAVAGAASIDRLTPVAFGLVFALTGAVGPILAQNFGAGRNDRVSETLRDALLFVVASVLGAWLVLFAAQDLIVRALSAHGAAADLVHLFCTWLAGSFLFTGALFVSNAAFNNLGFPLLSTLFNWGRATLGTIPLVTLGRPYGPQGVLLGLAGGSLVFGVAAVVTAFRVVGRMPAGEAVHGHGSLVVPAAGGTSAVAAFAVRPPSALATPRPRDA